MKKGNLERRYAQCMIHSLLIQRSGAPRPSWEGAPNANRVLASGMGPRIIHSPPRLTSYVKIAPSIVQ